MTMTYVWGSFTVHNQSTSGLEKDIAGFVENKGISMNKCTRQGSNGTDVISGAYKNKLWPENLMPSIFIMLLTI